MKNKKLASLILGGACLLTLGGTALATTVTTDTTPPRGVISIEGASLRGDTYYTTEGTVTLNISVADDVSSSENIKMIVSNTPITGVDAIDDSNWMSYTSQITNWTLPSLTDVNIIYLYLKDEAGNISPNIVQSNVEYTVTYDANGGANAPAAKNASYGTAFNISINEPTYENKYFLGWSLTADATSPSWNSDGVIEPKYIKSNITLYAVWTDTAPTLAEVAKIGDYVNYPVNYDNVFTQGSSYKSAYTGWRIVDISGDTIKIVTAGTPLTFKHGNISSESVTALTTNFLTTSYVSNGFSSYYIDLTTAFSNPYTTSVESIKKEEVEKIIDRQISSGATTKEAGSILHNDTYYWIALDYGNYGLWNVNGNSGALYDSYTITYGVRPVVASI